MSYYWPVVKPQISGLAAHHHQLRWHWFHQHEEEHNVSRLLTFAMPTTFLPPIVTLYSGVYHADTQGLARRDIGSQLDPGSKLRWRRWTSRTRSWAPSWAPEKRGHYRRPASARRQRAGPVDRGGTRKLLPDCGTPHCTVVVVLVHRQTEQHKQSTRNNGVTKSRILII